MPNPSAPQESDDSDFSYGEGFAASVANDIGESLFAKTEPEAKPAATLDTPSEIPEPAAKPVLVGDAETPAHPNVVPGQNSEAKPMPKSWKKDMEAHWSKLPAEVHEYVHTREAQVMRGIQQYQEGAQAWNNLIQPYAPIFQSQPDVQPVALMQGLMNTHLQLLNPDAPQEKKQAIIARLLNDYGIQMEGFTPPAVDPRVNALETQLNNLLRQQQLSEQRSFEAGVSEQTRMIEAFAADPKNTFFPEVANDILRFIQTGVAADLASAYDMACWVNPAVRAKRMAQQAAPSATGKPTPRASNGQYVPLDSEVPPTPRTRAKSMDATIDGIVSKHFPSNAH